MSYIEFNHQGKAPNQGPNLGQGRPSGKGPFDPANAFASFKRSLIGFLLVMGPGLIVMEADNDAGAVSTYTQAGAQYGTHLLWLMLILLPITYFMQEMVARIGIAAGEGFSPLIYRRFGKGWGLFSQVALQLTNFFTLVTEFAAISLVAAQLGLPPLVVVPLAAVALILLVVTGTYLRWERIMVGLCLLDALWFIMAFVVKPRWDDVAVHAVVPTAPASGITSSWIFLVVAIIGTTIAPWQLFFQQSCVCDKGLQARDLKFARVDTFVGAFFTVLVAGAMMLVGDAMHRAGGKYDDPTQMADFLFGHYGSFVRDAILLMFLNAAVLGTTAVSLSSSWAYAEVKGWPHSLRQPFAQAKPFYLLYVGGVLASAFLVLIPNMPLQFVILAVQVLAAIMLPCSIVFLQFLANDRDLIGETFVNRGWNNLINWAAAGVLLVLSIILVVQAALPSLFTH